VLQERLIKRKEVLWGRGVFGAMNVPVDTLGWKWISHFYTSIFIETYLKYYSGARS